MFGWVRRAACLCSVAVLAACGGGGGGSSEASGGGNTDPGVAGAPYYPLTSGARWRATESGELAETRVLGTVSLAGELAVQVQTSRPSETSNDYYVVNDSGVFSVPGPDADALTRAIGTVQVMSFPLRVGERFVAFDRKIDNLYDVDGDGRADPLALRAEVTVVGFTRLVGQHATFDDVVHQRIVITQTFTSSRDGRSLTSVTRADEHYARGIGPVALTMVFDTGASTLQVDLRDWVVNGQRSDTTAPSVASRTPADRALSRAAAVSLVLTEAIEADAASPATLQLLGPDGQPVPGTATSDDLRTFNFAPGAVLGNGTYTARLAGTAQDWAGNPVAPVEWSFTLDARGPTLVSSTPSNGSTDVPIRPSIRFTFDEALDPASVEPGTVGLFGPDGPLASTVSISGNTLTVVPDAPLVKAARHQVRVGTNLTDLAGNPQVLPLTLDFDTDPGRFALPVTLPGMEPGRVPHTIMADLTGDGRRDLVAALGGSGPDLGTMQVVRATGAGSFEAATTRLPFSTCTGAPTAADFNGDGRVDIVSASGFCGGLQWWSQSPAGDWNFEGAIAGGDQWRPHALSLVGSARPALVATSATAIQLLRPAPGGGFAAAEVLYPASVASVVGDFNGDGRLDVALVADTGLNPALVMLWQQADASFVTQETVAPTLGQVKLAADLDGDGRTDLVVGERFPSTRILLYRQTAAGTWAPPVALTGPLQAQVVRAADMNGDGRIDLVVRHDDPIKFSSFTLFTQATDGTWAASNPIEWGLPVVLQQVQTLELADFNADGLTDILLGNLLIAQRPVLSTPSQAPRRGSLSSRRFGLGAR